MTSREAAIISAYTGILVGDFANFHRYIEEIMDRPVMTHELGCKEVWEEIKSRSKSDFLAIPVF